MSSLVIAARVWLTDIQPSIAIFPKILQMLAKEVILNCMSTLVIDDPIDVAIESTLDMEKLLGDDEFPSDVYLLDVGDDKYIALNFDTDGMEPDPMIDKRGLVCHGTEDSALAHMELQDMPPCKPKLLPLEEAEKIAKSKSLDALLLMKRNKIAKVRFL